MAMEEGSLSRRLISICICVDYYNPAHTDCTSPRALNLILTLARIPILTLTRIVALTLTLTLSLTPTLGPPNLHELRIVAQRHQHILVRSCRIRVRVRVKVRG